MLPASADAAVTRIDVGQGVAAALVDQARPLGFAGWDFAIWPNGRLDGSASSPELAELIGAIQTSLSEDGFCVVRLARIVEQQPAGVAAGAVTLLASALGSPLRVYGNNPAHWRSLGADPKRPANRSEGVGLQLPHTDFCNAEYPPDVVCLLCLRPDPLGGGASLVARMEGIEAVLDPAELDALSQPVFNDGQVVNLTGIGEDANPFAIISPHQPRFRYRFVGHLLESAPGPAAKAAVHALVRALIARTHTISLAAGDLLLVNQHLAVHGRAALGAEQENLPVAARRNLLLSFLRTAPVP